MCGREVGPPNGTPYRSGQGGETEIAEGHVTSKAMNIRKCNGVGGVTMLCPFSVLPVQV